MIVGVVTDEQVIATKKTRPYILFEERLAIVQACRYVDEAVEIPADKPGREDAFYKYYFDVQFSGSDYADNPFWLAKKIFSAATWFRFGILSIYGGYKFDGD